jgi:choline dehydrogenase-like flavoprotein
MTDQYIKFQDILNHIEPLSISASIELSQFEEHNVVVVGSGPGASLAACLLSETGHEVIVLEEGDFYPHEVINQFSVEELMKKYRNGGVTIALGKPMIQYVEGRCLGGGSEINSGLHHRLPDEVVWNWTARYGLESFTPQELNVQSEAIEKDLSVSYMPKGTIPQASTILKLGSDSLGWNCLEVPRYRHFSSLQPSGERQTMTNTYLSRAKIAGAKIIHGAKVTRIRPNLGKTWRIDVKYSNNRSTIIAKTVFLGAGTIGSPVILRRSGLSKKSGKFFHLHPTVKFIAQFDQDINYPGLGVSVHQVKEFGTTMSFGCSISSPHYLSVALASRANSLEFVRDHWRNLIIYYATITPEGHGSIILLPGFKDPVVRFNLTKRDLAALSLALKRLGRLLFAAGAKKLFSSVRGLDPFHKPSDLDNIPTILPADKTEVMTIHLTASNQMAASPKLGVVDQWGALWGSENLYVSDASILCSAPGVNPQGPLLTVARRNLTHFLGG